MTFRCLPLAGKLAAVVCVTAVVALLLGSCGGSSPPVERVSGGSTGSYVVLVGIHKIKHVVVIMQENRSFDSYFGTFPGADGIPDGRRQADSVRAGPGYEAVRAPYPDHADVNGGGPHNYANATSDINGGKMDGFIGQAEAGKQGCADPTDPACTNSATPATSWGTTPRRDIPNYWTYAKDFVLQDHMFEPNASWSLPSHLFLSLGVGRVLHPGEQPGQLRERHQRQSSSQTSRRSRPSTAVKLARRRTSSVRPPRTISPSTPGRI